MTKLSINEWSAAERSHYVSTGDQEYAVRTVDISGLVTSSFDSITTDYPNDTTEVYNYRTGGTSGDIVGTVTVIYVDNTKEVLSSVEAS